MTTTQEVLSPCQAKAWDAVQAWLADPQDPHPFRLSGAAGTGKTWLVRRLVQHVRASRQFRHIYLLAPTHKATGVLAEGVSGYDAIVNTVHSALGLLPTRDFETGVEEFVQKGEIKVMFGSLLIIDEASMINDELLALILTVAAEMGCRVMFVGDQYQVPPVGDNPSAIPPVFRETLPGKSLSMTTIMRQALENPLIRIAHGYREWLDTGHMGDISLDPVGVELLTSEQLVAAMTDLFRAGETLGNPDYVRLTAYTNENVLKANAYIRHKILGRAPNPPFELGEYAQVNSAVVINKEIALFTDELVEVVEIQPAVEHGMPGNFVTVRKSNALVHRVFAPANPLRMKQRLNEWAARIRRMPTDQRGPAWREFFGVKESVCDLRHPFGTTVHKSQGSTYDYAVINVADIVGRTHNEALAARLLYVALTRPRYKAYLNAPLPEFASRVRAA